jgi:HK97 family phage prohead protease
MTDPLYLQGEVVQRAQDGPEAGDGRTVRIRMVRWDTPVPTPEGYTEAFARGAFAGVDPGRVTIEAARHGGTLVGRGLELEEPEDAGYLTARVARTPAGDELLALIDDGVLREASVAYVPKRTRKDGDVLVREAVDLWRVAIVERGIHTGAEVVAVRSATDTGGREMVEVIERDQVADDLIERAIAPVMERMERVDHRLDQLTALGTFPVQRETRPGEDAGSLGELMLRAWDGRADRDLIYRALVDQILIPDNAALARPAFITEAVGIVNEGRPAIEAFGGARSLPDSGMRVEWPALVPLSGRAVGVQTAEKTEITSVKVSFTNAGADLKTYAGGSDISVQLLRRSTPAYRDLYARVMLAEYARVTDDAFTDALILGAGDSIVYVPSTDDDGTGFAAMLFEASVKIQRATGAPASVAAVAEDVFIKMGAWMRPVGPQNQVGTGNAAGLDVNISGVQVVLLGPDAAPGTIVVSNRRAAAWYEDGPNSMEANDVAKLGVNTGYYGIAGTAIPIPAGVITTTLVAGARAGSRKSSTAES